MPSIRRFLLYSCVICLIWIGMVFGSSSWSTWEKSSVLGPGIWSRVKICNDTDDMCIRQEETIDGCLGSCGNVGSETTDFKGFGSCRSLCYKHVHTRNLGCPPGDDGEACSLLQIKRCYNTESCLQGEWGQWNSISGNNECSDKEPLAFVRICIKNDDRCDEPGAGGPSKQTKLEDQPCIQTTTSSATTTTTPATRRTTTDTRSVLCTNGDCASWLEWGDWTSCSSITRIRTKTMTCRTAYTACVAANLVETKTEPCIPATTDSATSLSTQSVLVLAFSVGLSAVVILGVIIIFCLKCRHIKQQRVKEAASSLQNRQRPFPSTMSSTLSLNSTSQRRLPSVPPTEINTPQRHLPSPPYSYPLDAIHNNRSPQIRMTEDSIYATITAE